MFGSWPRSVALTLALSACSFSIRGPRSKIDPGRCDRAAPVRKALDGVGLVGTGLLMLGGLIIIGECDAGFVCSKSDEDGARVAALVLLTPPVAFASALLVGSRRTSACASAQDASLKASEDRRRAQARQRARVPLLPIDDVDDLQDAHPADEPRD